MLKISAFSSSSMGKLVELKEDQFCSDVPVLEAFKKIKGKSFGLPLINVQYMKSSDILGEKKLIYALK